MKLIEGVVERVNFKDIDEDQWGNTCRASIKIGDDWIGLGTAKKHEINLKEGAGWYKLKEGDKIAIVAEESEYNGKVYLNGQRKTIKVLSKGATGSSQTAAKSSSSVTKTGQSTSQPSSAHGGGTDWARKDAGAAASASIDKALAFFALAKEVPHNNDILDKAREFQQMVRTLADEILAGPAKVEEAKPAVEPEKPKAPSSRKQPPKPAEPEDDFDQDEIPF